jgi:hypothetical protein
MISQQSKLGNLLFALGAVGGGLYAAKRSKPLLTIALISLGAGLGGYLVGNSITNFYSK